MAVAAVDLNWAGDSRDKTKIEERTHLFNYFVHF